MITELYVRNYGPAKNVVVKGLTPIHAFIGPNDSGKSTLLRAVRVLAGLASGRPGAWALTFDPQIPRIADDVVLACRTDEGLFRIDFRGRDWSEGVSAAPDVSLETLQVNFRHEYEQIRREPSTVAVLDQVSLTRTLRLDPDMLRLPAELLLPGAAIDFTDDRGTGLAAVLDALRDKDDGSYDAIREQVCALFPEVARLQLQRVEAQQKAVAVQLVDGTTVPAAGLSEGLLYFLAVATLRYLAPVKILLVEEPENGLHPARIQDVMRVLREVSKSTQVLIATHSPLVVNELEPEEVSVVVRKRDVGTTVTRIVDTPNFEERSRVYALGELWLSYANGEDEAPLLERAHA